MAVKPKKETLMKAEKGLRVRKPFTIDQRKKKLLIYILLVLVLGLALYRYKGVLLAAVVGKSPITRAKLNQELRKRYGEEVLENLITEKLILQEAKKQNVSVDQADIDKEIEEAKKEIEAQGGSLEDFLAMQGMTIETIKDQIRLRLIIEQILGKDVEISDEEAEAYFEENAAFFPEGTKFEDSKEEIKGQLSNSRISEKFQEWITNLRTQTKVHNFL